LTIIMFVWMAKFGAAYGVRTGIHVGVDVLINRLDDQNARQVRRVFGLLAGATFTGIVGTLGAHFVWENGAHYAFHDDGRHAGRGHSRRSDDTRSRVADMDSVLGDSAWAVSLMCFRFLQVLAWLPGRTGELPHHDHGHVDGLEDAAPQPDIDVYAHG
jgi:C4-dicarboxylate transporter DctQ subunit